MAGELEQANKKFKGNPSEYVKLNVGGTLHFTTVATLTKNDTTMLAAMFSGRMEVCTDPEGWVLIDRSGKHFETILNFLRDGNVALPESAKCIAELLAEAQYYCIQDLAGMCEHAVDPARLFCHVPLITPQNEEHISIGKRFTVKLQMKRNEYGSLTSVNCKNLLKNIELFDKLSLRFTGRVMFVKDVLGTEEYCCWSFFEDGKIVTEICCNAIPIVYRNGEKHKHHYFRTEKIDFPEVLVLEEIVNILLRNDQEQA